MGPKTLVSLDVSKPEDRGFIQAYVGNFIILAICSNSVVWQALTYGTVSPLLASFSMSIALQEDSGQNIRYVLLRTLSVSLGGAIGLLILYLIFWANGSSFSPSLVKGSTLVVFVACVLSVAVYFFRPPVWSIQYKSILLGGIGVCLVAGEGYWNDRPLPLIYAYVLLNMSIGLALSYLVAQVILPIRKSIVVREKVNAAISLLKGTATNAVNATEGIPGKASPQVPVEVGSILIKCKVLLFASVSLEHRFYVWPMRPFPLKLYLSLCTALRKYVTVYGTLVDLLRRSAPMSLTTSGATKLRLVSNEMEESFRMFLEVLEGCDEKQADAELSSRFHRLDHAVSELWGYLRGGVNDDMLTATRGASRAVVALMICLGKLVLDMYPVVGSILPCNTVKKTYSLDAMRERLGCNRIDNADELIEQPFDTRIAELDQGQPFKHHKTDPVSRVSWQILDFLHLERGYMKAVCQASVAISAASLLLVCEASYYGLGQHALWVLITVWIMSAQSTIGSVALKAVNRIFGTVIAGALSYVCIYLVYLVNGLSYANRAPKYVFMTILYPFFMALLHREMIKAAPQYKYAFYVSKITLAIATLATYGGETVNPSVAAWRLLCVLIGLGIEFVVKLIVFYRESATSMMHRVQDILQTFASGQWAHGGQQWRLATAQAVNDLEKLEELVLFEDKISDTLHLPNLFDRRLIRRDTMPTIRRLLRLVLNRILTIFYLRSSMVSLGTDESLGCVELKVYDLIEDEITQVCNVWIPACLAELANIFGGDLKSDGQAFDEMRRSIDHCRNEMIQIADRKDVTRLTWTICVVAILQALGEAMIELREYLILAHR
jgi:uncharacterized membrane protein YgaE (UPF0421/DUF939 family)